MSYQPTPNQVERALSGNPEALRRYRELCQQQEDEERRFALDNYDPDVADTFDMIERNLEDGWPYADDDAA